MQKKYSKKLKHFRFGIEYELFTLDEKGRMINAADRLIKRVRKEHREVDIIKECGKNMVEVRSSPHITIHKSMEKTMADFENVLACAEKEKIVLYAFGTYPGKFIPLMNQDKKYFVKQQLLGKQRFAIAGRCVGLHVHYTLPWGVFDQAQKIVKLLFQSKNQRSMVSIYNMFIAMDPALTTFTQSSPFYQGKHIAKDSRVVVYRGGDILKYPEGLYAKMQKFGRLPQYRSTGSGILQLIGERSHMWNEEMKKIGMNMKMLTKHGSLLSFAWNPVRVSSHGTMEQRGMDMNGPTIVMGIANMIKYVSKAIQEQFLRTVPSPIGIEEPFKLEKGAIHIPPDSHVRIHLQAKAAYDGLEDDDVHRYCTALLGLAKKCTPKDQLPFYDPLERMLEERKTVADRMLADAKVMGANLKKGLTNEQAAKLALAYSKSLPHEISAVRKALAKSKRE